MSCAHSRCGEATTRRRHSPPFCWQICYARYVQGVASIGRSVDVLLAAPGSIGSTAIVRNKDCYLWRLGAITSTSRIKLMERVPVSSTAFRESRLYKSWNDCTCFELTRCRRSDVAHFDFYTTLPHSLPKAIAESRKRYRDVADADLHVCISHKRRRAISTAKQRQAAEGKECVVVPAGDDPAFSCFVGTRLVGSSTGGRFVNGGRYSVTRIGGERACLKDEMTEDEFETSLEAISKHCLLAWAMTYPKVQGSTESSTVLLHDMGSKFLRRCHLYVGLSRTTSGSNVFIAHD